MGGSAPTDMRVRPGRGPRELRAKSASLLEPYGLCDKRSTGLERRFRIPNPDSNSTRGAQRSHRADLASAANLACGVRAHCALRYPQTYPKNLWLLLEVLGSPWRIGGCESSLETEPSGVCWMSMDVPGSPWTSLDGSPGRIPNRSQVVERTSRPDFE